MKAKNFAIIAFVLVALAQLYVPAKMIFEKEGVISGGKEFKFRCAPVDPNDPFRGKYITLRFDATSYESQGTEEWESGEDIFVLLTTDSAGYAIIKSVSKEKPDINIDYVKAKIYHSVKKSQWRTGTRLTIEYPFEKYYMEESKANPAEKMYRTSIRSSAKNAYALVSIKNGEAVLKDVMIDKVSIKELVKEK